MPRFFSCFVIFFDGICLPPYFFTAVVWGTRDRVDFIDLEDFA